MGCSQKCFEMLLFLIFDTAHRSAGRQMLGVQGCSRRLPSESPHKAAGGGIATAGWPCRDAMTYYCLGALVWAPMLKNMTAIPPRLGGNEKASAYNYQQIYRKSLICAEHVWSYLNYRMLTYIEITSKEHSNCYKFWASTSNQYKPNKTIWIHVHRLANWGGPLMVEGGLLPRAWPIYASICWQWLVCASIC